MNFSENVTKQWTKITEYELGKQPASQRSLVFFKSKTGKLNFVAMKRGELTMTVCADYSKAFDTVQFKAVWTKIHGMGFSRTFLQ